MDRKPHWVWWAAAGLFLGTVGVFARSLSCDFVHLDDNIYVFDNPLVTGGIRAEIVREASTAIVGGMWHPLTLYSHMLDGQLYGLEPAGHHLSGVLLHAATVTLLFLALGRMTGAWGASLAAAVLFGWHPLRVESVTWVAERKDVLSGVLAMATLLAYGRYARSRRGIDLAWTSGFYALGLLAKPTLVPWPFVLLLLDYWPLGRWRKGNERQLVLEKLPLFALSGIASAVTYLAQASQGAVRSGSILPLPWRLANAAVAYTDYIGQTIWPVGLAIFYPHPAYNLPLSKVAVSVTALVLFSVVVWKRAELEPYLPVGWCWYLGMLVPTIGLVQVGGHARADRYTYLPAMGLAILVAFAAARRVGEDARRRQLARLAMASVAGVLAVLTWIQIGHWDNSRTLYAHAIEVTEGNFLAEDGLGHALLEEQRPAEALVHLDRSVELLPAFSLSAYHRAQALERLGRFQEALAEYERVISLGVNDVTTYAAKARMLIALRQWDAAEQLLAQLEQAAPGATALLEVQGELAYARENPREALEKWRRCIQQGDAEGRATQRVAWLLATAADPQLRNPAEGVRLAEELLSRMKYPSAELLDTLGAAYAANGDFDRAIEFAEKALVALKPTGEMGQELWPRQAEIEARLAGYRQGVAWQVPTKDD
jgi:tetratricopeptide (TPR) repeat protein